ncbi:MAG: HYR domain-containing protein [Vicinamibacterales bacterium]
MTAAGSVRSVVRRLLVAGCVAVAIVASSTTRTTAGPAPGPAHHAIHDIQGSGDVSPLLGQTVETDGIVTARTSNGFFLQTTDVDADPNTSEGLFVFTAVAPPAEAQVGNFLTVTGTVQEFAPASDPLSPTVTELAGVITVILGSAGNALPSPVTIAALDTNPSGAIDQLEKYEGMRVRVDSLTVVAPTGGVVDDSTGTSTSTGDFFGVVTGVARPFREAGVPLPDPLPAGSPCGVPRFDTNPERLKVDSDALGGATLEVATGAIVTNLTGPLDYSDRTYTILQDPPAVSALPGVVPGMTAQGARARQANEFTVATLTLSRVPDPVKLSAQIRTLMGLPDIIAVQNLQDPSALWPIAEQLNADAADQAVSYFGFYGFGNDPTGATTAFIVNLTRVPDFSVFQADQDATFVDPVDGSVNPVFDQPPLLLQGTIAMDDGSSMPIEAIDVQLLPQTGIGDAVLGPRVRAKRQAQAELIAELVQSEQSQVGTNLFVAGNFNADRLSDGYVDVIGTVTGAPTPASQVVLASPDLVDPNLVNLDDHAGGAPYTHVSLGSAEALDHLLVNGNALAMLHEVDWVRANADFPDSGRNDSASPLRTSDHDPVVAYFAAMTPTVTSVTAAPNPATVGQDVTLTATVTAPVAVTLGSVRFDDGAGFSTAAPLVNGQASVTVGAAAFGAGSHVITAGFSATGLFGPSSGSTSLTVLADQQAPVLSLPGHLVAEATSAAGAVVTFSASATDDVDGVVPVTCTPASGSTFGLGDTLVGCSAHDAMGNVTNGSFTVTTRDTTPPVIAPHADVSADASSGTTQVVTYVAPSTSDAVDGAGVASCAPASGSAFPVGSTTVTCQASDAHQNAAVPTAFAVVVHAGTVPAPVTPRLTVTPSVLWPPLGQMVHVRVTAHDGANNDVSASCAIASITSNDRDDWWSWRRRGRDVDFVVTGPMTASLRAERNDGGRELIYTLHVSCRSASGAAGPTLPVNVVVPRTSFWSWWNPR